MLTLIIGGARSGKSELALRLAHASARDVLFVATMEPRDDELRARVARHRSERPAAWRTLEAPRDLVAMLEREARPGDFIVVDCITLWVSNMLTPALPDPDRIDAVAAARAVDDARAQADALAAWCDGFAGDVAAVTNEVGAGVVPAYPLGRAFRDAMGAANAALAARAQRVFAMTAGLAVDLKAVGARPLDSVAPRVPQ